MAGVKEPPGWNKVCKRETGERSNGRGGIVAFITSEKGKKTVEDFKLWQLC